MVNSDSVSRDLVRSFRSDRRVRRALETYREAQALIRDGRRVSPGLLDKCREELYRYAFDAAVAAGLSEGDAALISDRYVETMTGMSPS